MNKSAVIAATKNRIDEVDVDDQIDSIIADAFDYSYRYDLGKLDKRFSNAYCPVVNGMAVLPDDILDVEQVTPALLITEKRRGNVIMSAQDVTFAVLYSIVRPDPSDTEELDMDLSLQHMIMFYCCSAYYDYKRKLDISNQYITEYKLLKQEYISGLSDDVEEGTADVYSSTTADTEVLGVDS